MTAPKKGPLELANRAELRRLNLATRGKDALTLAAAAVVLSARADELPDVPMTLRVECDHPDHEHPYWFDADVPEEYWRVDPVVLAKVLGELRQTMTKLTEGLGDGDPLAALTAELGQTTGGGPPLGHPER